MRVFSRHAGLLLLALAAGCSTTQTYPGAWPRVDPTRIEGCPPVTGEYLSDGVRADPFAAPTSLSELALETPMADAIIRITQYGADSLALAAWKDGKVRARRVFSRARGDLACAREGVRLSCGWRSFPAVNVLEVSRHTLYLARATEGSLMVQDVEFYIDFFLLLPFPGMARSWHRFSPPTFPLLPPPAGEPPIGE